VSVLESQVDAASAEFGENRARMDGLVAELRERLAAARSGGGEEAVRRHREQGKLLARERVERLLDPGTPFLEIGALAGFAMHEGQAPSAGLVCGIGRVRGREVAVVANDATVKGGTYFPITVKKHLRAQEVALENRLPCVYLVDSGGAFLPLQAEVFPDRDHFGRIFYNQARHERPRHRPGERGARLLHRGRGLRAGDERRDGDRQRAGHDLPRRAAAREGGDGGGGDGRGARRRGRARADLRRRRPLRGDEDEALAIARDIVGTLTSRKETPWEVEEPEDPLSTRRSSTASSPPARAAPTTSAR
jgi:acetyl-CoA carboxylase carboxyltransferase component